MVSTRKARPVRWYPPCGACQHPRSNPLAPQEPRRAGSFVHQRRSGEETRIAHRREVYEMSKLGERGGALCLPWIEDLVDAKSGEIVRNSRDDDEAVFKGRRGDHVVYSAGRSPL